MAYSNFALFHGIPSLYTSLPPRQRQRRTATNIMAGCFDPLPALAPDSGKEDSSSSSQESSMMIITEEEDVPGDVLAGSGRGKNAPPRRSLKMLTARRGVSVKRVSEVIFGREKQVRRVIPEEKENAMSDSDTGASLSPIPLSSVQVAPPPTETPSSKPKASGFWLARSSNNTPEGSLATSKRKHSSLFNDDSSSPPPESLPVKKSRLSESTVATPVVAMPSPSSDSLTSLDAESGEDIRSSADRLKEAVWPHTVAYGRKHPTWVRCRLCPKIFETRSYIEKHFTLKHPEIVAHVENPFQDDISDHESQSIPAPTNKSSEDKKRPRKNVAVKKGWKGWVEEDLEPQKLILLDKPEVLPGRTTRSGRKID